MTASCLCGAELISAADQAHGVCRYCRVDAKKPVRRRSRKPDFTDVPLFDAEPCPRRLVPLDGWPDYRAELDGGGHHETA